jgi:hypothetical protein
MKPLWRIADLIDFEYLLFLDDISIEKNGQDVFKRRDREIYLQMISIETEGQRELNQSILLYKWLTVRQRQEAEQAQGIVLPGRAWNELYRIVWWSFLLLGLTIGTSLAFSFLDYSGSEPVNITRYLISFVGVQILLFFIIGATFLYRLIWRLDLRSSFLYSLLSRLMVSGVLKLNRYFGKKLTGQQRLHISAAQGLLREKLQTHGSCLLWPVFILLQVLTIGFNFGVLGATLLKVISSDIAFGWQSTLQVTEQFVFTLVKTIALPWSWFVPEDIAYPSLVHIKGSQMTLKEGIYHLVTIDLVSWWPFLCFAVLFYGLLPRIALLFVGLGSLRLNMTRLQFKRVACKQLLQRMTTSQVSSQAPIPDHSKQPTPLGLPQLEESAEYWSVSKEDPDCLHNTAVALIPNELYEQCSLSTLQALMQKRLGVDVREILQTGEVHQNELVMLGQLEERKKSSKVDNVVILQEAWQPPILEFLLFLKQLRSRLGADVPLFVALVGKPRSDTIFTSIKIEDLEIWRLKIRAMGEADIQIMELVVGS